MKYFFTLFLVTISALSFYTPLDESALLLYEDTFNRAVYSFALVKGLNAIISVLQSTEINMSLFVGATIGIGQILDPINDLVERFSLIMLFASVSIGIQNLLLFIGKSMFIKITIFIFSLLALTGLWIKKLQTTQVFFISLRVVFFMIILRFGAIFFMYTTEFIYTEVYATEYQKSNKYIEIYKNDLEVIQKNKEDFNSLWEKLKQKTEQFSREIIKLITMFIVTTILLPLIFIWFYLHLFKKIFTVKFDYDKILLTKLKEVI